MSQMGHLRHSIGGSPTDVRLLKAGASHATIGSSTPTSGPTRAVAGTEASCQQPNFLVTHVTIDFGV